MPNYDYVQNGKIISCRESPCFSETFRSIDKVERISVYVFPHGGINEDGTLGRGIYYGFRAFKYGKILEKYNTPDMLGVEKWAMAMSFIPKTSFVPEYTEKIELIENPDALNAQMSEFRFEKQPNVHVSPVMRQLWLNGIRYAWEEPFTIIPDFVLSYYKPEMTKLELFNLHLLAHILITDLQNGHSSQIENQEIHTQEEYEKLMTITGNSENGTYCLKKNRERNPNTYKYEDRKIDKAVHNAMKNIERGEKPPSLQSLLDLWRNN